MLSNSYTVDSGIYNLKFTIKNNYSKDIAIINRNNKYIWDEYQVDIFDDKDLNIILTIVAVIVNYVDMYQRR